MKQEICLALLSYNNDYESILDKKSYLEFLETHSELLDFETDILVILNGGEGALVKPEIAAQMDWIMPE